MAQLLVQRAFSRPVHNFIDADVIVALSHAATSGKQDVVKTVKADPPEKTSGAQVDLRA